MASRLRGVRDFSEVTVVTAADPLTSGPAASVRGLSRTFGDRTILAGLDLDIAQGEFIALIGRSGSGKSTLLRALAGLDREVTGQVSATGPISVAFQEPRLVPWKKVLANVALGLRGPDPQARARIALDEVELTERADAWPVTLSGGEAQRASLARALVRDPRLLLLDEPFSALDALTTITMHRLVLDRRSCWLRTTSTRRSPSPTGSSSSTTAGSRTLPLSPCRGRGTVTTPTWSRCD
jgi:sulfonate transport system ATP-binding protein